mmetsp:Transcript_22283/g.63183  ORF Transcript_22283/g.63183 Transcript_22283/m.63183 type:complete len:289 (-) Transcript_22283:1561-2427(-)
MHVLMFNSLHCVLSVLFSQFLLPKCLVRRSGWKSWRLDLSVQLGQLLSLHMVLALLRHVLGSGVKWVAVNGARFEQLWSAAVLQIGLMAFHAQQRRRLVGLDALRSLEFGDLLLHHGRAEGFGCHLLRAVHEVANRREEVHDHPNDCDGEQRPKVTDDVRGGVVFDADDGCRATAVLEPRGADVVNADADHVRDATVAEQVDGTRKHLLLRWGDGERRLVRCGDGEDLAGTDQDVRPCLPKNADLFPGRIVGGMDLVLHEDRPADGQCTEGAAHGELVRRGDLHVALG